MDALSIILIAVVAILIIALVIVLIQKKPGKDEVLKELTENHKHEIDALLKEHEQLNRKISVQLEDATAKLVALERQRAEELRQSAERIAALEKEISIAAENGADELVKARLTEAKTLANRVEELETELKAAKSSTESSDNLHEEIEKLKNQIKGLEEDLEEAEEDADESKKKAKKLLANLQQLQEDLSSEERKSKKYLNDFNETKDKLEKLEKEFQIREEALDFVTEILTAKRTDDANVSKLYADVESTEDFINGEVRDTLKATNLWNSDLENQYFGQELTAWAISKKKTWIQGKTTIAFVGEFSAGKTSIVNRLLSQDNPDVPLLPTSTKATTAIPTYITGGLGTFYQFVTPNNELKGITEATFKRVSKEVLDQVQGVSSLIQYFVMTYKNPYLDKMSILDTPGFNSNDSEDEKRTIEVINECDALFWVFDVNAGTVNRSSLKKIKENLRKPLYIIINQIDTKSDKDVDSVESLIRKTLSDEGVSVCGIIRFSRKEPLHVMMDAIKKIAKDNSREVLLENLIGFMSAKAREASKKTKTALQKSNRLRNKVEKLQDDFQEALQNLIGACEYVRDIPSEGKGFINAFRNKHYEITEETYKEFAEVLDSIGESHKDILSDLYDKQMHAVSELETAWQEHSDAMSHQRLIHDCEEKLLKKWQLFAKKASSPSLNSSSSKGASSLMEVNNSSSNYVEMSNDSEETDSDDEYTREWNDTIEEWKKQIDEEDYTQALLTLDKFYIEHAESPDFPYCDYSYITYVKDYINGGNLKATLNDIEEIIEEAKALASDEDELEQIDEWEQNLRSLQGNNSSSNKGYSLDRASIVQIIDPAITWEGNGFVKINWGKLTTVFNQRTGCSCLRAEFQKLVGFENAELNTKIQLITLINNMQTISFNNPVN